MVLCRSHKNGTKGEITLRMPRMLNIFAYKNSNALRMRECKGFAYSLGIRTFVLSIRTHSDGIRKRTNAQRMFTLISYGNSASARI